MNVLAEIFFPHTCPGCGVLYLKEKKQLCIKCLNNLEVERIIQNNLMLQRIASFEKTESCYALFKFKKETVIQNIIHNLKYRKQEWLGAYIAKICLNEKPILKYFMSYDILLPVPISIKKKRIRKYNQLHLFCEVIAETTGQEISYENLTVNSSKKSQAKKNQHDRWQVKNPFYIKNIPQWRNKKILLIDDVMTTGATLIACLNVLNKLESKKIGVFCLAYNA